MREGVLQKLSEQHIERFPTTENKSTGAFVVNRAFQKLLLWEETNGWIRLVSEMVS